MDPMEITEALEAIGKDEALCLPSASTTSNCSTIPLSAVAKVDVNTSHIEVIDIDSEDEEHPCELTTELVLEYPLKDHERFQGSVQIYLKDVRCLGPAQYLNDKIIDFWMTYISLNCLTTKERNSSFVFSSLFYNSIRNYYRGEGEGKNSRWTKNIPDLFDKDFLFIPISEASHWVLAVVCFPRLVEVEDAIDHQQLQPSPEDKSEEASESTSTSDEMSDHIKICSATVETESSVAPRTRTIHRLVEEKNTEEQDEDPRDPKAMLMIFDSFTDFKINKLKVAKNIRVFLSAEWKRQKRKRKKFDSMTLPLVRPKVPQQQNSYDCGIFVLQYFEYFFAKPIPHFCNPFKFPPLKDWFPMPETCGKREQIFQVISSILRKNFFERLDLLPLTSEQLEDFDHNVQLSHNTSQDMFAPDAYLSDQGIETSFYQLSTPSPTVSDCDDSMDRIKITSCYSIASAKDQSNSSALENPQGLPCTASRMETEKSSEEFSDSGSNRKRKRRRFERFVSEKDQCVEIEEKQQNWWSMSDSNSDDSYVPLLTPKGNSNEDTGGEGDVSTISDDNDRTREMKSPSPTPPDLEPNPPQIGSESPTPPHLELMEVIQLQKPKKSSRRKKTDATAATAKRKSKKTASFKLNDTVMGLFQYPELNDDG